MIVLVGFMGAGKSTVGRLLALRLGAPFLDSDAEIERVAGRSVREIFESSGEAAFRDLEESVVADLLAGPSGVLALGGGTLGREATRARLAAHTVVYLDTPLATVRDRVGGDADRPVLARPDLEAIYAGRVGYYLDAAHHVVATDGCTPEQVVDLLLPLLTDPRKV